MNVVMKIDKEYIFANLSEYSGRIQTGELAPGTKMPSENELARGITLLAKPYVRHFTCLHKMGISIK